MGRLHTQNAEKSIHDGNRVGNCEVSEEELRVKAQKWTEALRDHSEFICKGLPRWVIESPNQMRKKKCSIDEMRLQL
jgi:hypothetical protein